MFKNKRKNIFLIISTFILLLISIISFSCMGPFSNTEDNTANQGIETFEVRRGDIFQLVSTTGTVDSETLNTYTISVSGEIISALEKGDSFKKGDILAEVDKSDGLLQLEKIESNLKTSESSLRTARLNYQKALEANHIAIQIADLNTEKAEESRESALDSLENANDMGDSYSISQAQSSYNQELLNQSTTYWNNLSSLESADTQIELARENLNQAGLQLELAKRDYEEAQKNLDDYILHAPYDGTVISSDFKVGDQNSGGNVISIISDNFLIKTTIGETDISKVFEGDEANITMDAYPDKQFSGGVEKIIPVTITEGNIVSFEVLVGFNDTGDIRIYYGLSTNVDVITEKAENVLYVPIQSVYQENGKSYVDVLTLEQIDSKNITENVKKVEVTTGINDYSYMEITSGLKEGDIVVTSRIQ